MRRLAVLLVPLVLLAACGSDDDTGGGTVPPVTTGDQEPATSTSASSAPPTQPGTTATPSTPSTTPAGGPGTAPTGTASLPPGSDALTRAMTDVVRRTGADPDDIVVVANEEVTWRDSSAGCPQKGMSYLQVLTDGTRIILQVDNRRFEYHAGGQRDLFYCASPQPPVGE